MAPFRTLWAHAMGHDAVMRDPIHEVIERWYAHLRGELPGGFDSLLAEDCVFVSPIVFKPQAGRELTKMYLQAASETLSGDGSEVALGQPTEDGGPGPGAIDATSPDTDVSHEPPGSFRYTKQVLSGNHAVLEFETTIEGTYVNGVDIITCDGAGMISEFRVMIRPLRAVNLLHAKMAEMLESMGALRD